MRPQQLCLRTHSIELISRQPAQHAFRLSSGRREHDQVAETVEEVLHKPTMPEKRSWAPLIPE